MSASPDTRGTVRSPDASTAPERSEVQPAGDPDTTATTAPLTVAEYEALAREILAEAVYDYYAGGAGDELTLRDNVAGFARYVLLPRVLVNVAERSLATSAFGVPLPHPIVVAPMARHVMAHADGEMASIRGSAAAGALFTLSTVASFDMESVAAAAPDAPRWFQLYSNTRPGANQALIERAGDAGYSALVVTVDVAAPGNRERDLRHNFVLPLGAHIAQVDAPKEGLGYLSHPSDDWRALETIRAATAMPLVVKGILRADDAARAVDMGADGVWVSNHGGRQLDSTISGIDAIAEVAEAVRGRALLVMDGGVRRGIDVLKAIALGADLVAVGRPVLWALAVNGAEGVRRVLELLRDELSLAMAIAGCPSLAAVTRDLVRPTRS